MNAGTHLAGEWAEPAAACRRPRLDPGAIPIDVAPIDGESLMGFIARVAAENLHPSTAPILAAAGAPHHNAYDLTSRPRCEDGRLHMVLGVPAEEVERRSLPVIEQDGRPPCVRFSGALVPLYDIRFRQRLLAPAALRTSAHHRLLSQHGLIPFCTDTGDMLIGQCPIAGCGNRFGWHSSKGIHRCDGCGFDLRTAEVENVGREVLAGTATMTGLIDPRERVHVTVRDRLHEDLRGLDRGAVFELGWRLGRIATAGSFARRDLDKNRPEEERVATLLAAADMLCGWPESVSSLITKRFASHGEGAALELATALRRLGTARGGWAEHSRLLKEKVPHILCSSQGAVRRSIDDGLDGAEAAAFLGLNSGQFLDLRNARLVRPVITSGKKNLHGTFSRRALEPLRATLTGKVAAGAAAERLGITLHGIEQLVCLGLLERVEGQAIDLLYGTLHVSEASLDQLISELESRGRSDVEADILNIPVRRALMSIGGREKPWGPILQSLLERQVRFRLAPGIGRICTRLLVGAEGAASLAVESFPRGSHRFDFSRTMPRRDAQELLNLTPRLLGRALPSELAHCGATGKRLLVAPLIEIARARISGGEVLARWGEEGRRLPQALRQEKSLRRLGVTGWSRCEVERVFAKHITP